MTVLAIELWEACTACSKFIEFFTVVTKITCIS